MDHTRKYILSFLLFSIHLSADPIEKCTMKTQRCPLNNILWNQREKEFLCFGEGLNYTCMKAIGGILVEACINGYEIRANTGRCPYIFACDGIYPVLHNQANWPICPEYETGCPPDNHQAYTVHHMYKYPACIVTNTTELQSTTLSDYKTLKSKLYTISSEEINFSTTARTIIDNPGRDIHIIVIVIVSIVTVTFAFVGFVAGIYVRRRKRQLINNKQNHDQEDEEIVQFQNNDDNPIRIEERKQYTELQRFDRTSHPIKEGSELIYSRSNNPIRIEERKQYTELQRFDRTSHSIKEGSELIYSRSNFLTDTFLVDISKMIGREWILVCVSLGVPQLEIDHLTYDNSLNFQTKIYKGLRRWKEIRLGTPDDELLRELKEAFKTNGRQDLVNYLQNDSNDSLPEKFLAHISKDIGAEWMILCVTLGVPQSDIDHITMDGNFDTRTKIYRGLLRWKELAIGRPACILLLELEEALTEIGRGDLAQIFLEYDVGKDRQSLAQHDTDLVQLENHMLHVPQVEDNCQGPNQPIIAMKGMGQNTRMEDFITPKHASTDQQTHEMVLDIESENCSTSEEGGYRPNRHDEEEGKDEVDCTHSKSLLTDDLLETRIHSNSDGVSGGYRTYRHDDTEGKDEVDCTYSKRLKAEDLQETQIHLNRDSFSEWCDQVGFPRVDFKTVDQNHLAVLLENFYGSAAIKITEDRHESTASEKANKLHENSLINARIAINQHLRDIGRDTDIVRDKAFAKANARFNERLEMMDTTRRLMISKTDLMQISSFLENDDNPKSLQYKVWYNLGFHFPFLGEKFFHELKLNSFLFLSDDNGRTYVILEHELQQKMIQTGLFIPENVEGKRMYATGGKGCPVAALRKYISHCDPFAPALFCVLLSRTAGKVWYTRTQTSMVQIKNFMPEICKSAKCSKQYTIESIWATAIQPPSNAGVAKKHGMQMAWDGNEASMMPYGRENYEDEKQESNDSITNINNTGMPNASTSLIRSQSRGTLAAPGNLDSSNALYPPQFSRHVVGQKSSQVHCMNSTTALSSAQGILNNSAFTNCHVSITINKSSE